MADVITELKDRRISCWCIYRGIILEIEAGSRFDPSESLLWVAKARLQRAQNMLRLALPSLGYPLATRKDADESYVDATEAMELAEELQAVSL